MKITCPTHAEHTQFNPALSIHMLVNSTGQLIVWDEAGRVVENWRASAHPEFTTVFCAVCGALCRVEP